jgi:hypothetical protein
MSIHTHTLMPKTKGLWMYKKGLKRCFVLRKGNCKLLTSRLDKQVLFHNMGRYNKEWSS